MSELKQIYQDIDSLAEEAKIILLDFIKLLKKCYSKTELENHQEEKSLYEKFLAFWSICDGKSPKA